MMCLPKWTGTGVMWKSRDRCALYTTHNAVLVCIIYDGTCYSILEVLIEPIHFRLDFFFQIWINKAMDVKQNVSINDTYFCEHFGWMEDGLHKVPWQAAVWPTVWPLRTDRNASNNCAMNLHNELHFYSLLGLAQKKDFPIVLKIVQVLLLSADGLRASVWSIKLLKGLSPGRFFNRSASEEYKVISLFWGDMRTEISSLSIKMSRCFISVPEGPRARCCSCGTNHLASRLALPHAALGLVITLARISVRHRGLTLSD